MPLDLGRLLALAIWYAPYAGELLALLVMARLANRSRARIPAVPRFRAAAD